MPICLQALNTKEPHSKQNKDKYYDVHHYKIGDLVMIKNINKNQIGTLSTYQI